MPAKETEKNMKIGEFAKKAGCLTVTIRYYEKLGLLPNGKRTTSNHRVYDEEDGERLRFILHCRNHKIPLNQIRKLLSMRDGTGKGGSLDAISMLDEHIEELKLQRKSLDELITSLAAIQQELKDSDAGNVGVIEILGSPCPHCPDYEEQLEKGRKMDRRAMWLAAPAKRQGMS